MSHVELHDGTDEYMKLDKFMESTSFYYTVLLMVLLLDFHHYSDLSNIFLP